MLKTEFESLPNSEKEAFAIIAQRDFQRSRFLWTELKELLLKCKGKISYATMANQLGDIVSPNTIAKWLKQQKGFSTRKDRVLPSLDKAAMLRRVVWAHTFWIFWYSARLVNPEQAIFVLVHMDEKWFYALKTRSNCKVLTSIGLEPAEYYAHHKNHIGKEMYIANVLDFMIDSGKSIGLNTLNDSYETIVLGSPQEYGLELARMSLK